MIGSSDAAPARPAPPARRPAAQRKAPYPWLAPGIFIGGLTPLFSIGMRALQGNLNADPIAQIENELGLAAIIFLIASLACTPARRLFGWTWPNRIRRELGLFAFFYASFHFLVYLLVDHAFDLGAIIEDIVKRPFITVGFLALLLMLPLAFTSTSDSVRRLGYRRWELLHRLAYVSGILAVIHFIWRVKIDVSQPLTYALVLGGLLLVRLVYLYKQRSDRRQPRPTKAPRPG